MNAASVKIVRLPGEVVKSSGDDLRDVLLRHGQEAVKQAIDDAEPFQLREGDYHNEEGKPEEVLTLREMWHVERVVGYLGELGWNSPWLPKAKRESRRVFQRGGLLVEVLDGDDDVTDGAKWRIRAMPQCIIRARISEACQLVVEKETADGEVEKQACPPPKWLIEIVEKLGQYGNSIRQLAGIVTSPTLRADGTILQIEGWDEQTRLIYRPTSKFAPIPEKPTRDDARQAAEKLLDVVRDFPFRDDADRSAWLALVLVMAAREAVTGCVPMFVVLANIRGAGKTLLTDSASIIAYGHAASRTSYASCDDEMRKRITAIAIEATPAVLIDNVDRPIGGAALDAALTTAGRWKDRVLGSSQTIDLPLKPVWMATGNNIQFKADIARRVLPIRLDSKHEKPEARSDFAHPDLLRWVSDNRAELAIAAITVVRAYFVAGLPVQPGGSWGSFESFSDIIRGAIVWAGLSDPLATRETADADDQSAAIVKGLIGGLLDVDERDEGVTCRQIIDLLNRETSQDRYSTMRELVAEFATKDGKPSASVLGYQLRKYRDRVANSYKITGEANRTGVIVWRAVFAGDAGDQKTHPQHHPQQQNTRKTSSESDVAGDAGDTFSILTHEANEIHCYGTGESFTEQNRDGLKTSPASPASPADATLFDAEGVGNVQNFGQTQPIAPTNKSLFGAEVEL